MQRSTKTLVALLGLVCCLVIGCAGTRKGGGATNDDMGRLQREASKLADQGYFAAVATEASMDLQTAIDNAALTARNQLAQMIEVEIKSFEKRSTGQAGSTPQDAELTKTYKSATIGVAEQALQGSRIVESPYTQDASNGYRAFVLVKVDKKLFMENFKDKINQNEVLKAKFEEKKIFEEADAEWKKYEEARSKE